MIGCAQASAQWVTESYPLKAGFNAIWLSIDCSDRSIGELLPPGTDVDEVWQWNANASATQFTQAPAAPDQPDAQWRVWRRDPTGHPASTLSLLTPNAAYLVKVADGTAPFSLTLKGKPVPPDYRWKSSGVNFVGFPTAPTTPPTFTSFLSFSQVLRNAPPVYFYDGGDLASNPRRLLTPNSQPVVRGQAYWVQTSDYTDFYGPLRVTVLRGARLDYGRKLTSATVRVKNVTDPAKNQTVTATFTLASSELAPGDATPLPSVPLRLRGPLDASLRFSYTDLPTAVTLAPGEERDLVLDADRNQMSVPDQPYAGILQVTDSLGHTRIDLPVSAIGSSRAGVWIGAAVIDSVGRVETIRGPEFDAPVGTPDGEGLETLAESTTTVTTTGGLTTRVTVSEGAFDAAGELYLSTAGLTAGDVSISGPSGTPLYFEGTDYSLAPSLRATVTNSGADYTVPPTVTLAGGGGSGATATATLSGSVRNVKIAPSGGGSGYTSAPSVTFTGGGGSGGAGLAVIDPESGLVTYVTVTDGGSGYSSAPEVEFSGGGGTGAAATAAIAGGVGRVTIVATGTGYTGAPVVSFTAVDGNGAGASATVEAKPTAVAAVTVTEGGSGYSIPPTVEFSGGGGSGAAGTAITNGDTITGVTITDGGSGYTSPPDLSFVGGDGTGPIVASVALGGVSGVDAVRREIGGNIAENGTVRITVSTVSDAPAGAPDSSTVSTITSTSQLVTLNGVSHLRTRRVSTGDGAAAPSLFPVRLILHAPESGAPTLMQQVYLGARDGLSYAGPDEEPIAAIVTAPGPTPAGKIGRVSSASFPRGTAWPGAGSIDSAVAFNVSLGHTAETNPFLHTYHPDHDSLDARYEDLLPSGVETYAVNRAITLNFESEPPAGVSDLGWSVTTVGGSYSEIITGLRSEEIGVSGRFILHQVSEVPVLTNP